MFQLEDHAAAITTLVAGHTTLEGRVDGHDTTLADNYARWIVPDQRLRGTANNTQRSARGGIFVFRTDEQGLFAVLQELGHPDEEVGQLLNNEITIDSRYSYAGRDSNILCSFIAYCAKKLQRGVVRGQPYKLESKEEVEGWIQFVGGAEKFIFKKVADGTRCKVDVECTGFERTSWERDIASFPDNSADNSE